MWYIVEYKVIEMPICITTRVIESFQHKDVAMFVYSSILKQANLDPKDISKKKSGDYGYMLTKDFQGYEINLKQAFPKQFEEEQNVN